MSIPSIYIDLEDDVRKITSQLKHQRASQVVLVCPRRCLLFADRLNLQLLKNEADALDKEIFILSMDEKGQQYAKEAGFKLKFLPKPSQAKAFSDIKFSKKPVHKLDEAGLSGVLVQSSPHHLARHSGKMAVSASQTKVETGREPAVPELNVDYLAPQEKSRMPKLLAVVVSASLILALSLTFVVLPSASVVVYARREPVALEILDISASGNFKNNEAGKLAIAGTKVEEIISLNDKFQSSGKKQVGNRATGTVQIYNFAKLPLNLKAETTTLIVGGKTYNLANDVAGIKPVTYKNAKTKEINPDSLSGPVEIIATQGGEDYNLPAGTRVEITNQVFGSSPQFLYAKTGSEIKGGASRFLSLISDGDVTSAKTQLQDKAAAQLKQKLSGQGLVLADKAYIFETPQFTTDNPAGTETPAFQASLQVKVSGMAFKTQDLNNLIFQRVSDTLSANKSLQSKNLDQITYKTKSLDLNNQLLTLNAHFEGQAVFNLDLPYLAPELVGKTKDQVNGILRSKAEIDRVDITLAPSWQKTFPMFARQIKVSVGE